MIARDRDGRRYREVAPNVFHVVTECCGAYDTGTDDGAACRACYRLLTPAEQAAIGATARLG